MSGPTTTTRAENVSTWYVGAMEHLVGVVQELSQAHTVDEVTAIVRRAARGLTGADGATFVLRDGNHCYYADEDAIAPLWKGKRFPIDACISGWVMQNARPAVIEDIYSDPRVPSDAYKPTFVKSLAMVPIRRIGPIGAIGNYWASNRMPTDQEVAILQALADTTSVALNNAELYGRLREQVRLLQQQHTRIEEQRNTLEIFTRALAHDLKEPIRTMQSFSRLVLEGREDPRQQREFLEFIRSAADRMGALVASVLHYMQLEDSSAMTERPCDMKRIADSVVENLAQLIKERAAVIETATLPVIQANDTHMMQILQNLIANAIRHNDRGVTVQVRAEDHPDKWLFTVRDDGRGIPPEFAQRIFQPFKRLKCGNDSGGFGLAVCERIVTRYGGTIWCESKSDQGAEFRFTVPRGEEDEGRDVQTRAPTSPGRDSRDDPVASILLVDDRPDDLMLSRMMLSRQGRVQCGLLTAQDGREALTALSRQSVDLMLLDINMPGMDGFEVLEHMQRDATLKYVTVIMCTGSDYQKDKDRAASLGATGYLVKPPNFNELRQMLEHIPSLRLNPEEIGYTLRRVQHAAR